MNYFDKCILAVNAKGVYTISLIAISAWIVMMNTYSSLKFSHPISISELLIWLNIVWMFHTPLFAFKCRPRIITRIVTGAITTHWFSFAALIAVSSGYSIIATTFVFVFSILVTLSNFRVELGDEL